MNPHSNSVRFVVVAAILASAMAGCEHGESSSPQYVPASATAASEVRGEPGAKIKIVSSCPKLIIIGGGTSKACTFQEAGYSGKFHITENPNYNYIFTVSPTSGNKKTSFVVTGLDSGGASYSVSDKNGNKIIRDVRVAS
jgi:hypothetical protein